MTVQLGFFLVLAGITLWSGYMVVAARLITHAAFYMALSFVSVAGIFILLNAEFLAAAQVLIYAGAVATIIIFAIMLSNIHDIRTEDDCPPGIIQRLSLNLKSERLGILPVALGVLFGLAMAYLYLKAGWTTTAKPVFTNTTATIGQELFTTYAVPFEVASLLLLVAMVGAIILTIKEGK